MRVLGDLAKIAITSPFGHFWSRFLQQNLLQSLHLKRIVVWLFGAAFYAKIFSSLCTLSAYYLEDNSICARVLLGLSNEGYFLDDF